jgi:hypothetical protein
VRALLSLLPCFYYATSPRCPFAARTHLLCICPHATFARSMDEFREQQQGAEARRTSNYFMLAMGLMQIVFSYFLIRTYTSLSQHLRIAQLHDRITETAIATLLPHIKLLQVPSPTPLLPKCTRNLLPLRRLH